MRTVILALVALATVAQGAGAQNETALRNAFEGRTLTVKVDMPATSKGIDVFPNEQMPVNWREVADRLKESGTALKMGQSVMITKVIVKQNSHIEFQLGGGGYGTFGDYMSSSSEVSSTDESESSRERELRAAIKDAPGPTRRKELERELANARSERERENSRGRAEAAQANEAREANLRTKRAESGSRFNLRYKHGLPAEALTPEGIAKLLAPYATFGEGVVAGAAPASAAPVSAAPASAAPASAAAAPSPVASAPATQPGANALLSVRKGLLLAEVEALLGPASSASEVKEGSLVVMKRGYLYDGKKIQMSFVGGVMFDYSISPR